MDADERDIFNYLKTWGKEYVGTAEICRRAGTKKHFHEDPEWAIPILITMKERGLLERDAMGRYRVKPARKKKGDQQVESNNSSDIAPDEYYEQL
ncbi:MAG: hypothetical protein WCH99_09150 [Verrucomicrobiota bacterium]